MSEGDRARARRAFWRAALRLTLLFGLVFYGADALTERRAWRVALYADWERAIPYWPAFYPVYFSVFALPWLLLARARSAPQVQRWERGMALAIAIAGAVFVLLPAASGFAPQSAGAWQGWAWWTGVVAGRHNLLPSLHVALSLLTLCALWPLGGPLLRGPLAGWFALLVASVLFTHQHHLADVLAGGLLGGLIGRGVIAGRGAHRPSG